MKYIVRSLKYFVYLILVLCLIILVMVKLKLVENDISAMFVNGYDSLWQMALIVAVFAAVYPRFGYSRRNAVIPGSDEEVRPVIGRIMEDRGYRLEKEDGTTLSFVKRSPALRLLKMWEDRLTLVRTMDGYEIEGPTKDIVRIASFIEADRS